MTAEKFLGRQAVLALRFAVKMTAEKIGLEYFLLQVYSAVALCRKKLCLVCFRLAALHQVCLVTSGLFILLGI